MHCLPLSLPALFCCYLNDVALSGILPFCFQQCYGPNLSYQYLIMEGKRRKELNLNVNSWNWRWVARPGAVHHDVYLRKSSASRKTLSSGPAPQQGLVPDNRMEKEILKMKKKLSEGFLLNQKTEPDNLQTWSEQWTFRWGFAWWTTLVCQFVLAESYQATGAHFVKCMNCWFSQQNFEGFALFWVQCNAVGEECISQYLMLAPSVS